MTEQLTNETLYQEWDDVVRLIESANRFGSLPFVEDRDVKERLAQILQYVGFYPYCSYRTAGAGAGRTFLECGGLRYNLVTGSVRVSWRLRAVRLIEGFRGWLFLCRSALRPGQRTQPVAWNVLLGMTPDSILHEDSDSRFIKFCAEGPITPLQDTARLLVQVSGIQLLNPGLRYAQAPLHSIFSHMPLNVWRRLLTCAAGLLRLLIAACTALGHGQRTLLAREYVEGALVAALDRAGALGSVLFTNSAYGEQPLWMRNAPSRRFKVHEIHYSQNTQPMSRKDTGPAREFPGFRHVRADVHWVWTEGYARRMQLAYPGCEAHAVGPIMWYLKGHNAEASSGAQRIIVFDVVPPHKEWVRRLGIAPSYYSVDRMLAFIEGIIRVRNRVADRTGKFLEIRIKHKRLPAPEVHDDRYLDAVENHLEAENGFKMLAPQTNLLEYLKEGDIAVAIPYTTAAYLACLTGGSAVYFDPDGTLLPEYEPLDRLSFASSESELFDRMLAIVDTRSSVQQNEP